MFSWIEIVKPLLSAAVIFGIVRAAWTLWKLYRDRPRLKVDVDWEWGDEDGDFPRINVLNEGGRTIYIETIALVEASGTRNVVGVFNNLEIKPEQRIAHPPVWEGLDGEPYDDEPQFHYGWEGMKVSVRDTLGREWFSDSPPKKQPKWFVLSEPEVNDWLDMPAQGALSS